MTDEQTNFAARATAGGETGFAAVVETHWNAVFRLLLCMTGNVHDSEELTQETFLRALRRIDSFQPGTQMRAWLLRIATNACLDVHRKQKRARSGPLPDDLPGGQPPPDARLETAEQGALVRAAMQQLSATTRAVFQLRAEESLSFREIAEVLGTSEQAARWHMHEARRKLLKQMDR